MNTYNNDNIGMETTVEKYEMCSYFTKEAIKKCYDMISEFIYADDCEDCFGYTELAIKIKNMKGIIPDDLHIKLLEFVTTEVREWMIYDVPTLEEINTVEGDEDVELADAVLETPYNVLRKLHKLADKEMEPYIGSKKYEAKEGFIYEEVEPVKDTFEEFIKVNVSKLSENNFSKILHSSHVILQVLVNEETDMISEIRSYGYDGSRKSKFTSTTDYRLLFEHIVEHHFIIEKNVGNNEQYDLSLVNSQLTPEDDVPVNIATFVSEGHESKNCHYEFYVSKGYCNMRNFGGKIETDFFKGWLKAKSKMNS